MKKRAIPSNRVRTDIDDFLSYHYLTERGFLLDKGELHYFIEKWEMYYFTILKNEIKSRDLKEDFLNEEEEISKCPHIAMKETLAAIRQDL